MGRGWLGIAVAAGLVAAGCAGKDIRFDVELVDPAVDGSRITYLEATITIGGEIVTETIGLPDRGLADGEESLRFDPQGRTGPGHVAVAAWSGWYLRAWGGADFEAEPGARVTVAIAGHALSDSGVDSGVDSGPSDSGPPPPSDSGPPPPSDSGPPPPSDSGFPPPSDSGFPPPSDSGFPPPSDSGFPLPSDGGT